jgi:two-component system OmpR family response regulator
MIAASNAARLEETKGRGKVLIIDDDEAILKLLNLRLRTEGFDTRLAVDAKSAFDCACEYHPNIILLDIAMPEETGADFLNKMQSLEITKDIPVIIITAYPYQKKFVEGYPNVKEFFVKPFELPKLITKIGDVIAESGK